MSFWTKIKKQVSRTGHKLGLDVNHSVWNAAITGHITGAATGAAVGATTGNPYAVLIGAGIGAGVGTVAGFTTGRRVDDMEEASEDYNEAVSAIAEASQNETVALTDNESKDVANQNDDRAARLASAYSLANTRSVTGKQLASSVSVKRSARGKSTLG